MDKLSPPKPLSLEGNVVEQWKTWKQNFGFYLTATECNDKADNIKASLFLHCVGDEVRAVYNTLTFDDEGDNMKYDKILEKLEAYISPRKNITFARYKFFTYRQLEGQSFDSYLTEMRRLGNDCELGALKDDLLRDMLTIGLCNKRIQEGLLREDALSLAKVIKSCQTAELTSKQVKCMQKVGNDNFSVDSLNNKRNYSQKGHSAYSGEKKPPYDVTNCKFCSYTHKSNACPAYGKLCNKCKKKGHFSKCCPQFKKMKPKPVGEVKMRREEAVYSDSDESDVSDTFFIGAVTDKELISFDEDWTIDLLTNSTLINYKIDTGAQANVLPYKEYCRLAKRPKLNKTKVKLSAYNDTAIPVKGSCIVRINYKTKTIPVLFIVADIESPPIIGLKTSTHMNLIQRVDKVNNKDAIPSYLDEYIDCFGTLGCFPRTHSIVTDPSVQPTVYPPRRLAIALQGKLYDELQRMVKMKVIVPVEEPTDWVNNLVLVEKPDHSLRLCLDPRDLNKAIKRPHFNLPTTEEILAKISTGKKFTKLDASCAYWQIPLDHNSSKLLTFSTPFGRYRFLRMAYGVSSASDVCQMYISQMIDGIQGATNSQDDIIIWGENDDELKQRTIKVFKAIQKNGMKLNESKCLFNQTEITFLGHQLTSTGLNPDGKKIKAIKEMPYPQNVKDLQRFLGTINYLGKFIPNLTDRTASLRKLLQKDTVWCFEEQHRKDVDILKTLVTEAPVLKFYNQKLPTKVLCDASSKGLGAVLEQKHGDNWLPVAFASRSLTTSEQNYCQLEKETLSIVFACTKFHEYLYGRKFYVFNDHLPLKAIFNKSITKAPPRIQRFLLRLQRYEFDMHYIKGSDLTVADALSRASLKDRVPEIKDEELRCYVHSIITTDLISREKLACFKKETENDECFQLLTKYIKDGWPQARKDVPTNLQPYFNFRQELSLFDGLILRDKRLVVPSALRKEMRKLLHSGHLGIVKTKGRARDTLYWPGINNEMEDLIQGCDTCQEYQNKLKKEPLLCHEIPEKPWTKIGTDCFELNSKDYLIVVDYTTNFFDISLLPDKKSSTVATHTKRIFSKFGLPKTVMSDNGPEFIGKAYKKFSTQWDFDHDTSSPHYPESNGQVERMIQLVKKTLRKAFTDDQDPYLALLSIRTSPGPYDGAPPATLFFNRPIRSTLPSMNNTFKPIDKSEKREKVSVRKSEKLPDLQIDDHVRLHDGKRWSIKGKVVDISKHPRSFIVETENGSSLRRNRRHILLRKRDNKPNTDNGDTYSLIDFSEQSTPNILDQPVPPLDLDDANLNITNNIPDEFVNILDQENNIPDQQEDIADQQNASSSTPTDTVTTRSGRIVKPPSRLTDYDLS